LVTDPIWKTLSGVASTPVLRLTTPVATSASSGGADRDRRPGHPVAPGGLVDPRL
jgi:hypothetical protein